MTHVSIGFNNKQPPQQRGAFPHLPTKQNQTRSWARRVNGEALQLTRCSSVKAETKGGCCSGHWRMPAVIVPSALRSPPPSLYLSPITAAICVAPCAVSSPRAHCSPPRRAPSWLCHYGKDPRGWQQKALSWKCNKWGAEPATWAR